MPDTSGDAPSGLAEDRIAALEAGFAGLAELLKPYGATFSNLVVLLLSSPARPLVALPRQAPAGTTTHRLARSGFPCPSPTAWPTQRLSARRLRRLRERQAWRNPLVKRTFASLKRAWAAYDVSNKHRRDFVAFIRLNASNDADARTKTVAKAVRRNLLKPGFAD
eukprot:jgi/Tetstr1/443774/TSEL_031762.t1